jgi:MoxR-like ATPase
VIPDDVKLLAEPTLAHRIIIGPAARMRGFESRSIVRDLLGTIPVPQVGRQAMAHPDTLSRV